ncbi:hypothetical protein DL98DRAFT_590958 [Cadophora sp. DSE1049]|nr:hypothetical protein DL98DRAFT_590958 [Cadophora sp. DSE1049]
MAPSSSTGAKRSSDIAKCLLRDRRGTRSDPIDLEIDMADTDFNEKVEMDDDELEVLFPGHSTNDPETPAGDSDHLMVIDLAKDGEEEEDEGFSEMEESLFVTRGSTPEADSHFLPNESTTNGDYGLSDIIGINEDGEEEESLFLTRESTAESETNLFSLPIFLNSEQDEDADSDLPTPPIALSNNPPIPQPSALLALPLEIRLLILDALPHV